MDCICAVEGCDTTWRIGPVNKVYCSPDCRDEAAVAHSVRSAQRLTHRKEQIAAANGLVPSAPICQACLRQLPIDLLAIDHDVPRSRGGNDALDNLQLLCVTCNSSKGTKTTAEWRGSRHYLATMARIGASAEDDVMKGRETAKNPEST